MQSDTPLMPPENTKDGTWHTLTMTRTVKARWFNGKWRIYRGSQEMTPAEMQAAGWTYAGAADAPY